MLRIDGAYLYELGATLKGIARISATQENPPSVADVYFPCLWAKEALQALIYRSVFSGSLRNSEASAQKLLNELEPFVPNIDETTDFNAPVSVWKVSNLKSEFAKFEAVFSTELQGSALYFVSPKGGFDTIALTDHGENLFPTSLGAKVPPALPDVKAGARCLAFELPTAAGFHFHRANEAVLRRYFDEVAGEEHRPKTRNMGDYIKKMIELKVGDPKVIDVLKSLKDLHRNPLMHPEQSIDTIEEAMSLQAAVRAAIGYMLDRIPDGEVPAVINPLPFG